MAVRITQLPHWRRLVIVAITLPSLVGLAVLAFAYPAARIEPRQLPVGVIGTSPGSQQLVQHVQQAAPDGFEFRLYPDEAAARDAIESRDIYGAFDVTAHQVRLLEASAAGPAAAQALENVAAALVDASTSGTGTASMTLQTEDVVPLASEDSKGVVFAACLLPLTICSILAAAAVALIVRFRPAWRQILALAVVASLSAAVVYLIGETYLDAFPHEGFADWLVLTLTVFAIGCSTAGLIALIGAGGLGVGAALMVFVGNPFAGVTSAPELLPDGVNSIGQLLPPGAGANALRSTAYFDGNGAGSHIAVLIAWSLLGIAFVIIGHHAPIQLAAYQPPVEGDRAARRARPEARRVGLRTRLARALEPAPPAVGVRTASGPTTPPARRELVEAEQE